MYLKQKTTMETPDPMHGSDHSSLLKLHPADDVHMHDAQAGSALAPGAGQGSGSTNDPSDQTLAALDMGSRWCPDEIEIFFECK